MSQYTEKIELLKDKKFEFVYIYIYLFDYLINCVVYCTYCFKVFFIYLSHKEHMSTQRLRHDFLLFLCNQLSEQDAWWGRLLADAKSLVMLRGEVK